MAFYTALTGLLGSQTELATLANNIANVGTHGFKRSRVSFGDIISSTPLQNPNRVIGSGTAVRSVSQQFQQGAIESSDSALDLAIAGVGFFTMANPLNPTQLSYTRAGAFSVNADRFVVDTSGRRLQLFPTDSSGAVLSTDLASTIPARLPSSSGVPIATSSLELAVNLPAAAPIIPDNPIYTLANPYVFDKENPATFNASTTATIFDARGNPQAATIYYVKLTSPTIPVPEHGWEARVFVGNNELTVGGTPGIPMSFDLNGVITAPTTPFVFDPLNIPGTDPLFLAIDHGTGTTQQTGAFNRISLAQNGVPSGQLESVAVDRAGNLQVSFTNGDIQTLGKVVIANFANAQGLKSSGDANFLATPQSGAPEAGVPGTAGLGSILSGSLERSNVDLTTELVSLIAAQRNFQASAKAIETDTTLLNTIINQR